MASAPHSTAPYSTAPQSTAPYITAQDSTAQPHTVTVPLCQCANTPLFHVQLHGLLAWCWGPDPPIHPPRRPRRPFQQRSRCCLPRPGMHAWHVASCCETEMMPRQEARPHNATCHRATWVKLLENKTTTYSLVQEMYSTNVITLCIAYISHFECEWYVYILYVASIYETLLCIMLLCVSYIMHHVCGCLLHKEYLYCSATLLVWYIYT